MVEYWFYKIMCVRTNCWSHFGCKVSFSVYSLGPPSFVRLTQSHITLVWLITSSACMERLRYELSFHETAYKHMYVFVIQLIVGCCCMLYVVVVVVVVVFVVFVVVLLLLLLFPGIL